jgi:hypothetical protein
LPGSAAAAGPFEWPSIVLAQPNKEPIVFVRQELPRVGCIQRQIRRLSTDLLNAIHSLADPKLAATPEEWLRKKSASRLLEGRFHRMPAHLQLKPIQSRKSVV